MADFFPPGNNTQTHELDQQREERESWKPDESQVKLASGGRWSWQSGSAEERPCLFRYWLSKEELGQPVEEGGRESRDLSPAESPPWTCKRGERDSLPMACRFWSWRNSMSFVVNRASVCKFVNMVIFISANYIMLCIVSFFLVA